MTSFALNNDPSILSRSSNNSYFIGGSNYNDNYFITGQSSNTLTTVHGGNGFDSVILNGSFMNYQRGYSYENGQMYNTFLDSHNNLTKIAGDVENIQFMQSAGGSYLDQMQNWFYNALNSIMAPPTPAYQGYGQQMPGQYLPQQYGVPQGMPVYPGQQMNQPMQAKQALEILLDENNFREVSQGDSCMNLDQLKEKAQNASSPELRAACQYMVDNESVFRMVERIGRSKGDQRISRLDLRKALDRNGDSGDDQWLKGLEPPAGVNVNNLSEKDAAQIIRDNFELFDTANDKNGKRDGRIATGDLEVIANDTGLPEHVRAAAKFMLNNRTSWNSLESYNAIKPNPALINITGFNQYDDRLTKGDLDRYLRGDSPR